MAILLVLFLTFLAGTLVTSNSPRIYGGHYAKENQFPHTVALYSGRSFKCGGSIINERFILTAAHCVTNNTKEYKIMVGSITRNPPGKMYNVKKKYIHPNYKGCELDIAILELKKPLTFSKSVAPIEIFEGELPVGAKVVISGWGRTETGTTSNKLKYVEVEIGEPEICVKSDSIFKHDYVLCLAHKVGNSICMGDSGGPAEYKSKLVGEGICVIGGCGSSYPNGYQKVSYFRNWINKIAFPK